MRVANQFAANIVSQFRFDFDACHSAPSETTPHPPPLSQGERGDLRFPVCVDIRPAFITHFSPKGRGEIFDSIKSQTFRAACAPPNICRYLSRFAARASLPFDV